MPRVVFPLAGLVLALCCSEVLSAPAAAVPPPIPLTRQVIDARVAAIQRTIWAARNAEGHWDAIPKGKPAAPEDKAWISSQHGGLTALALLALKASGVDEKNADFQKALKWLVGSPAQGTYFRGLRATLYGQLKDPAYRKPLLEDGQHLLRALCQGSGMYSYGPPPDPKTATAGDFSCTQYGILGIWAAADAGMEIPVKYWQLVQKAYVDGAAKEGGWGYSKGGGAYGTMTMAGLATLFIIWDKYYIANDGECRGIVDKDLIRTLDEGLDWMGKNFSATQVPPKNGDTWLYYYLYGIERVGVASGLKYFGRNDWYRAVAGAYVNNRITPRNLQEQAWMLLFLSYGRAPVAFNKLHYGSGWNQHPRDFAGLCKYLTKVFEEHHNWQVIPIEARQDEFHDAPILAMSSRSGFTFRPADVAKIKLYLQRGGTLFVEQIEGSSAMLSTRKLCQQMFPSMEMVRLSNDHPLYNGHSKIKNGQPEVWGLSDGVRTMVILANSKLTRRLGCDWQKQAESTGRQSFEFGDNLLYYASDAGKLWSKEESYWPIDEGRTPATTITIGRLIHGEAKAEHVWNPTGTTGWQRMDILSRNHGGPAIATTQTDLTGPLDPAAVPILHLTGAGGVALAAGADKNLADYVKGGGLLLVDAAGGTKAFVESFTALSKRVFSADLLNVTPSEAPFLATLGDQGRVWFRHRFSLPRAMRPLDMLFIPVGDGANRKVGVLFLPYDLTYALNGAPAMDPIGLEPGSATTVAAAVVSWRTGIKVPTSAPDRPAPKAK